MYLEHFGLDELPFESTSNARIFIDLPDHRDAMNTILFGIESGEGFVKIVGEVGTGKTALCRILLTKLPADYAPVYLPNPSLNPVDLLRSIADELDLANEPDASAHALHRSVREALIEIARRGGRTVLCVDEAQAMANESLEMLRLLTNLESNHGKIAQVVLFGQPELDERLGEYALRQLQQRIAFSAHLNPLDRSDTRFYIERRIREAGAHANAVFTPAAIERIFRGSGGIPRLINVLCHKSLLAAFSDGDYQVTRRHTARALDDTDGIQKWKTRPLISRTFLGSGNRSETGKPSVLRTRGRWSSSR